MAIKTAEQRTLATVPKILFLHTYIRICVQMMTTDDDTRVYIVSNNVLRSLDCEWINTPHYQHMLTSHNVDFSIPNKLNNYKMKDKNNE